jgi:hypothetical protein
MINLVLTSSCIATVVNTLVLLTFVKAYTMSFDLYLLQTKCKYQETLSKDDTTNKKMIKSSYNIIACIFED